MKRWLAVVLAVLFAVSTFGALAEEVQISGAQGLNLDQEVSQGELACAIDGDLVVDGGPEAEETGASANAGDVAIDAKHFPEAGFREYVAATFDKDGNGILSAAEIKAAKEIRIGYEEAGCTPVSCKNLKGVEYLVYLTELTCMGCGLTKLDVSKNTRLIYLNCCDNKLSSLNVSKNTKLLEMSCDNNRLTKLDVSKNTKLFGLYVPYNKLSKLDVSKNTKLLGLGCAGNKLKTLDLSKNKVLNWLDCGGNQLTKLDVSRNTKLAYLVCSENKLSTLDVSKNTKLTFLVCSKNKLSALDVGKNVKLETLGLSQNKVKKLDVTRNTRLVFIDCFDNPLNKLDLSNNKKMNMLYAFYTNIKSIDIKNCPGLKNRLKLDSRTQDGVIMWGSMEDGNFVDYLDIDVDTKLTAGSKVLYAGA